MDDGVSDGKRRRLSPDARREALLTAAHDLFGAQGFAEVRMDDVAAAAGVSKGTVYLYFPTKDALFEALIRRDVVPRLGQVLWLLRHYNGPIGFVLKRIAGFIGGKLDAGTVPLYPKILIREAWRFPELARFYHDEVVTMGLGALTGLFERAMQRGEIARGDPAMQAHLFVAPFIKAAVWYFTFSEAVGKPPISNRDYLRAHVDRFLAGLKPVSGRGGER